MFISLAYWCYTYVYVYSFIEKSNHCCKLYKIQFLTFGNCISKSTRKFSYIAIKLLKIYTHLCLKYKLRVWVTDYEQLYSWIFLFYRKVRPNVSKMQRRASSCGYPTGLEVTVDNSPSDYFATIMPRQGHLVNSILLFFANHRLLNDHSNLNRCHIFKIYTFIQDITRVTVYILTT